MSRQLKAFNQTLTTIHGIGDVLAAGIIAEIGDIKRFNNEAALAKYAGLIWNKYQDTVRISSGASGLNPRHYHRKRKGGTCKPKPLSTD
ncbi:IS110 family transposase [Thermococcus sp.]|uniref:IS110 family transposase n=1 Tax=Thermococcus sp. TaxID=35749 RepID=UPI00338F6C3D